MKKNKKDHSEWVWLKAMKNLGLPNKKKYDLTCDMISEKVRPEPEIIENILEGLENKLRHYFNLYQVEKEKRSSSEKNNFYLKKEIQHAYVSLDKNKLYTEKLEQKLNNIKENQNSLIDTVRRIDLLYIQLDTLVQSFAGICTQVLAISSSSPTEMYKKINVIKMLLDYIYPCRTLDTRLNSLYGMLYYQYIGLMSDNDQNFKKSIPIIPPVMSSNRSDWLPPPHTNEIHRYKSSNNDTYNYLFSDSTIYNEKNNYKGDKNNKKDFSNLVKNYNENNNNNNNEFYVNYKSDDFRDKKTKKNSLNKKIDSRNYSDNDYSNMYENKKDKLNKHENNKLVRLPTNYLRSSNTPNNIKKEINDREYIKNDLLNNGPVHDAYTNVYKNQISRTCSDLSDTRIIDENLIFKDLQGFDIKLGEIELKYQKKDPRIICVVRYDNESIITALQNNKRVIKIKNFNKSTKSEYLYYNFDTTIHLDTLPEKNTGIVPSFMIDLHDISDKILIGTCKCSFISERTLQKNAPWYIYSKTANNNVDRIGKIYVTVLPYPHNVKLPVHLFKNIISSKLTSSDDSHSSFKSSHEINKNKTSLNKHSKIEKKPLDSKTPEKKTIGSIKPRTVVKVGKRVTFKQYVSKSESQDMKEIKAKEAEAEAKEKDKEKEKEKDATEIISNTINNNINKENVKTVAKDNKDTKSSENKKEATNEKSKSDVKEVVKNYNISENKQSVRDMAKMFNLNSQTNKKNIPINTLKIGKNIDNKMNKEGNLKLETKKASTIINELNKTDDVLNKKVSVEINAEKNEKVVSTEKKEIVKKEIVKKEIVKKEQEESNILKPKVIELKEKDKAINKILPPGPMIKKEIVKLDIKKVLDKKPLLPIKTPLTNKNVETQKLDKSSESVKSGKSVATKDVITKDVITKELPGLNKTTNNKINAEKSAQEKNTKIVPNKVEVLNDEKKQSLKSKMFSLFKKSEKPSTPLKNEPTEKKNVPTPKSFNKPNEKKSAFSTIKQKSTIDDLEIKQILEKSKKSALVVNKSKISAKMVKKVEMKKAIKKFVPKITARTNVNTVRL
ncbi:conserved protein, unknown function [Hepatocystis sp. ex Piliocolobus tephrosceles]|nr:conserved protein, unknown function [Hepatocystis sp. ex Piliocolobus tephrosceles]